MADEDVDLTDKNVKSLAYSLNLADLRMTSIRVTPRRENPFSNGEPPVAITPVKSGKNLTAKLSKTVPEALSYFLKFSDTDEEPDVIIKGEVRDDETPLKKHKEPLPKIYTPRSEPKFTLPSSKEKRLIKSSREDVRQNPIRQLKYKRSQLPKPTTTAETSSKLFATPVKKVTYDEIAKTKPPTRKTSLSMPIKTGSPQNREGEIRKVTVASSQPLLIKKGEEGNKTKASLIRHKQIGYVYSQPGLNKPLVADRIVCSAPVRKSSLPTPIKKFSEFDQKRGASARDSTELFATPKWARGTKTPVRKSSLPTPIKKFSEFDQKRGASARDSTELFATPKWARGTKIPAKRTSLPTPIKKTFGFAQKPPLEPSKKLVSSTTNVKNPNAEENPTETAKSLLVIPPRKAILDSVKPKTGAIKKTLDPSHPPSATRNTKFKRPASTSFDQKNTSKLRTTGAKSTSKTPRADSAKEKWPYSCFFEECAAMDFKDTEGHEETIPRSRLRQIMDLELEISDSDETDTESAADCDLGVLIHDSQKPAIATEMDLDQMDLKDVFQEITNIHRANTTEVLLTDEFRKKFESLYAKEISLIVQNRGFQLLHPPRRKKLVVFDLDNTLINCDRLEFDTTSSRPYLHELLFNIHPHYDIALWSATSRHAISMKIQYFKLFFYEVLFTLSHKEMAVVSVDGEALQKAKPLQVIWDNMTHFDKTNTIMVDDSIHNFYLNPNNGLCVKPYYKVNHETDKELLRVNKYLMDLNKCGNDFSLINHNSYIRY